ncbi:hypothetical protein D3C72_2176030 [compost metagenome]
MFDDFDHVDVRQVGRLTEFCQVQLNDQGTAHCQRLLGSMGSKVLTRIERGFFRQFLPQGLDVIV